MFQLLSHPKPIGVIRMIQKTDKKDVRNISKNKNETFEKSEPWHQTQWSHDQNGLNKYLDLKRDLLKV